jgi:hypothetical protein
MNSLLETQHLPDCGIAELDEAHDLVRAVRARLEARALKLIGAAGRDVLNDGCERVVRARRSRAHSLRPARDRVHKRVVGLGERSREHVDEPASVQTVRGVGVRCNACDRILAGSRDVGPIDGKGEAL